MRRPLAVVGFSMLITSLVTRNLSFKMTIALFVGAMVIFLCSLIFKKLRKNLFVVFISFSVAIYSVLFALAQIQYYEASVKIQEKEEITGVVCQIPNSSDYAHTYIIKPDGENYKVRYVFQENQLLSLGDRIKVSLKTSEKTEDYAFLESALAGKVYFTFLADEETQLVKFAEKDLFYSKINVVKDMFSSVIDEYLPNENGAVAKAMTIGDIRGIDDATMEKFNFSGTSHLLVISGLHLTLLSMGIMNFLERFSRSRIIIITGMFCLLVYASITGFSISVIRAGVMVAIVLLGKFFNRDADSVNSLGCSVAILLMLNPFCIMSVSFWFTVLSTLGILVCSDKISLWFDKFGKNKPDLIKKTVKILSPVFAVSFSSAVFTLPVFVLNFKIIPIAFVLSNFVMVSAALVLMILAFVGVLFRFFHLFVLSQSIFFIIGIIGNFLRKSAQLIGMSRWSTISVAHNSYKYFLWFALFSVVFVFIAKKYGKDIVKHITVFLSLSFVLLSFYNISFDYHNPSVDIYFTESKPVVMINSKGTSVLVDSHGKDETDAIADMLNSHNNKQLNGIFIAEADSGTYSQIIMLQNRFGKAKVWFSDSDVSDFNGTITGNTKELTLGGNVTVTGTEFGYEIFSDTENIAIIDTDKAEKDFKNNKKYDIIFLYGENISEFTEKMKMFLKNESSELIVSSKGKTLTHYF